MVGGEVRGPAEKGCLVRPAGVAAGTGAGAGAGGGLDTTDLRWKTLGGRSLCGREGKRRIRAGAFLGRAAKEEEGRGKRGLCGEDEKLNDCRFHKKESSR